MDILFSSQIDQIFLIKNLLRWNYPWCPLQMPWGVSQQQFSSSQPWCSLRFCLDSNGPWCHWTICSLKKNFSSNVFPESRFSVLKLNSHLLLSEHMATGIRGKQWFSNHWLQSFPPFLPCVSLGVDARSHQHNHIDMSQAVWGNLCHGESPTLFKFISHGTAKWITLINTWKNNFTSLLPYNHIHFLVPIFYTWTFQKME